MHRLADAFCCYWSSHSNCLMTQLKGLRALAARTGHSGADFWTLYYFAREILTGEKESFDIYGSSDITIPGIQAVRSALEGGKPMEVPDFRKKSDRERYRHDDWQQRDHHRHAHQRRTRLGLHRRRQPHVNLDSIIGSPLSLQRSTIRPSLLRLITTNSEKHFTPAASTSL